MVYSSCSKANNYTGNYIYQMLTNKSYLLILFQTFQNWYPLSEHAELQIRCVKWTSIDSTSLISSPISMLNHLLESSRWDDSNKLSNIEICEEIGILEIEIRTLSGALVKDEYFHILVKTSDICWISFFLLQMTSLFCFKCLYICICRRSSCRLVGKGIITLYIL